MALLDDLRAAAAELDGQFQPAANELQALVGAIIQFLDHGKKFLQAAEQGAAEVQELVSGVRADDPDADADPEGSPEQRDKAASKASKQATAKQTKVQHEEGGD